MTADWPNFLLLTESNKQGFARLYRTKKGIISWWKATYDGLKKAHPKEILPVVFPEWAGEGRKF